MIYQSLQNKDSRDIYEKKKKKRIKNWGTAQTKGAKLELSFGRAINRDTRSTPTVTLHAHPSQSQGSLSLPSLTLFPNVSPNPSSQFLCNNSAI